MNKEQTKTAVVVGASGGIARALVNKLLSTDRTRHVVAISRSKQTESVDADAELRLRWMQSDNSDESMASVADALNSKPIRIDRLFICNGVLHQHAIAPEKRLKSVDRDALHTVFEVNAFLPILWLKHLLPLMPGDGDNAVTVFSARVGSIEDNRAGGWYAYRASKAAMNMLLKTAAIEHHRFARNTRFLAFHPGTTDTALSAPFQKGVPQDKLFSPDFVAERLLQIVETLPPEPTLSFLDWEGKAVAW